MTRAAINSTRADRIKNVRRGETCVVLRRTVTCLIAIGVSAMASVGGASALDYPTRPVRWVVGFAPGGANDILARLIG
jgi:hypothetical protein